jgi:hypothetical protein
MNRHFLFSARAICLLCTCWQYENGLLQIGGCCIESLKSCLNIEAYSIQLRNASDAAIEIVLEFFQVFTAV